MYNYEVPQQNIKKRQEILRDLIRNFRRSRHIMKLTGNSRTFPRQRRWELICEVIGIFKKVDWLHATSCAERDRLTRHSI